MATSTVEDYLKCIYLAERGGARVPPGRIASSMRVAPGTVTAMMKTLTDSGLVSYEPYVGVRLTPAGSKLATHILRRHRLVEKFLVEVMGMGWSEVHQEAEILEHAVSDRLIECIDDMLGRPFRCRMPRHVDVDDAPPVVAQDHEDVEHLEGDGGHDEEVDRNDVLHVVREEGAPGLGRWILSFRHQAPDGPLRDVDA